MRRLHRGVMIVSVFLLPLAACGGGDSADDTGPSRSARDWVDAVIGGSATNSGYCDPYWNWTWSCQHKLPDALMDAADLTHKRMRPCPNGPDPDPVIDVSAGVEICKEYEPDDPRDEAECVMLMDLLGYHDNQWGVPFSDFDITRLTKFNMMGLAPDEAIDQVNFGLGGGAFTRGVVPGGFFYAYRTACSTRGELLVIAEAKFKAIRDEWATELGYPPSSGGNSFIMDNNHAIGVVGEGGAVTFP